MHKKSYLIALLLMLALLLAACGTAAEPPDEMAEPADEMAEAPEGQSEQATEQVSYERVPDEAYEAVEYTLYPAPEGGYVGDVMPFVTGDGTLELYYLFDTDNNGQGTEYVMNHELVQREDKTLGVKAPEIFDGYFTVDKPVFAAPMTDGVEVDGNNISLSADENAYALADMGTRPACMTLECDVSFDDEGCVGFAFGGSESDETYTALCLDARRNLLHYEGYEIEDIRNFDPMAVTKFDFSHGGIHHVKLVCENEIVVLYVDDVKALSSRITHSIDGAHIGVFADGCSASFDNITIKLPG